MPSKPKIIIGIDPSFTRTGLAIFCTKSERIISVSSFTSARKKKYGKSIDSSTRITIISNKILEYLITASKKYSIISIGIESPSYGKFTNNSMAETGGLYYSIISVLINFIGEDAIVPIRPRSVKLIATGNGNAKKEEVMKLMDKVSDCKLNYLDESDAAAIALSAFICFDSVVNPKKYSDKIINATRKVLQE